MSRWSEREIARKLAERDELEPPAGLLEKIKSEIPPEIPVGTGVPEVDRRPSRMPPRQRWLMAASIAATVGAGLFALHLQKEAPPMQEPARAASGPRQLAAPRVAPPPPPAVPPPTRGAVPQPIAKTQEAPALRTLPRRDEEKLKALGYVSSEAGARAEGGVSGGVVANAPAPAPAPPPPAAPAEMAEVQAPAAEPATEKDKKERAAAEAPLLDERRAGPGADQPSRPKALGIAGPVSKQDLEKTPTARDPWAVLQSTPGIVTDRINVGGNESGQQSPGRQLSIVKVDVGSGSYAETRRDLLKGRLPDPRSVRAGDFVSAVELGASRRNGLAVRAEGAPTPFGPGPRYRLLRFNVQDPAPLPKGTQVEVELNPEVVAGYRLLGQGSVAVAGGQGVTLLYEVELRAGIPPQGRIATLRLRKPAEAEGTLDLSGLAPSWEAASPEFRLSVLAAQFAELLRSRPTDPNAFSRLLRYIRAEPPHGPGLAELADLVERAARIRAGG